MDAVATRHWEHHYLVCETGFLLLLDFNYLHVSKVDIQISRGLWLQCWVMQSLHHIGLYPDEKRTLWKSTLVLLSFPCVPPSESWGLYLHAQNCHICWGRVHGQIQKTEEHPYPTLPHPTPPYPTLLHCTPPYPTLPHSNLASLYPTTQPHRPCVNAGGLEITIRMWNLDWTANSPGDTPLGEGILREV